MESRSLGKGRVSVPVVGLGTWRRLEAAAAAGRHGELVEAAVAAGIRVIDTSPMYGEAEQQLSDALGGHLPGLPGPPDLPRTAAARSTVSANPAG